MKQPPKSKYANHELVTIAILLLGGDSRPVDLEDIAVQVNDLAPGRFAWRKYTSQINIKYVDDALRDAKKIKNGSYVLKSSKDEWLLPAHLGPRAEGRNRGTPVRLESDRDHANIPTTDEGEIQSQRHSAGN